MSEVRALRLAMWSGPRNISTALMRAWENRPDTVVSDEPFYGLYLSETGADHPGAADVIAAQETDWRKVVAPLIGPLPQGVHIFYQKHMTQHLLDHIDRDWLDHLTNCFLIRAPSEMLASYAGKRAKISLYDLGVHQQAELFEYVRARTGRVPPVIDAADVLAAPREVLTKLCQAVGVEFSEAMLSWPAGPRDSDGVWAKHWYDKVRASTGFERSEAVVEPLPGRLQKMAESCEAPYRRLHEHRITP